MKSKMVIRHNILLVIIFFWPVVTSYSQKIDIVKLRINTPESEFAPFVHDSVLYFVTNRKKSILVNYFNNENQHLYNIYKTKILKEGKTSKVTLFNPGQNIILQAGPATISQNGQNLIITQNKIQSIRVAKSAKNKIPLGLYSSTLTPGKQWEPLIPLTFSDKSEFSFAQPSLSPDGNMLFFVSDINSGKGKTDIYMSKKTSGGWGEPINIGTNINTNGRELFPYYHPSGKLYFTSDGHNGLGGLDIFYSTQLNNEWTTPVRLEAPINTVYDDFSCYIFTNEKSGYFASNRDGSDNIYHFNYKIEFCENAEEVVEENYCFTFFEETAEALETPSLKYKWEFSDGHNAEGLEIDHCLPGPGLYQVNLNVIDAISGEQQYNVAAYELNLEKPRQVYFTAPEKIKLNQELVLKANLTGFDDAENVQYFWKIGDKEEQIGETISHIFRKKGKYQIQCEAYWGQNQKLCSYRTIIVE